MMLLTVPAPASPPPARLRAGRSASRGTGPNALMDLHPPPPDHPDSPDSPGDSPDLAVARAALAGDRAGRDALVARLAPLPGMLRARRARMGLLLDDHELEDAVQAALLAVWRKLARYDGRGPLLSWAYGFGVLELLKIVDRRARQREVGEDPSASRRPVPTRSWSRRPGRLEDGLPQAICWSWS